MVVTRVHGEQLREDARHVRRLPSMQMMKRHIISFTLSNVHIQFAIIQEKSIATPALGAMTSLDELAY